MKAYSVNYLIDENNLFARFIFTPKLKKIKSKNYSSIDDAKDSPLVQQMFYLPFVKSVKLTPEYLILERFDILKWEDVIEEVSIELEKFLNEGGKILDTNHSDDKSPITIYAESTPNPDVMKFVSNKILVNNIYEFKNIESSNNVPLIKELFNFPYVKEVFINENYISIAKKENTKWEDSVMEIREFIRDYLQKNNLIIDLKPLKTNEKLTSIKKVESLDDISKKIIKIIDDYIKPAVASDGGNILFESYQKEKKLVNVILQGACSGCPSSTFTLKNGIENMLKEMLPGKINSVNAING